MYYDVVFGKNNFAIEVADASEANQGVLCAIHHIWIEGGTEAVLE